MFAAEGNTINAKEGYNTRPVHGENLPSKNVRGRQKMLPNALVEKVGLDYDRIRKTI